MIVARVKRHHRLETGESQTVRFEGRDFASPVSMFLSRKDPGKGSGLHLHPYRETWVVQRGEAEFTVGKERIRATAGDIVVAPADVPHRFLNVGSDRLEIICIHPSDTIWQQDL
ncbi:cupin domain-containing protein [Stappia sp. MMSF_3263]|uniref:cupin domain-containing protein n=1 Tax=Stappia sp. MMSF_3263 TaxID=3046693 RepID=UPI00273E933D|nr:cupin domain-containing protein [Stappia sp. MMSF_3263]